MNTKIISGTEASIQTSHPFKKALQLVKIPILLGLLISPFRFSLEMAGLPENAIFLIGLLWFTLGISVYWGIKLYKDKQAHLHLFLALLLFSPVSRIPISLLWWMDTEFNLGTHYGLFFDNFPQAFLNQVIYGSLVQMVPGFLLGALTIATMRNRKSSKK